MAHHHPCHEGALLIETPHGDAGPRRRHVARPYPLRQGRHPAAPARPAWSSSTCWAVSTVSPWSHPMATPIWPGCAARSWRRRSAPRAACSTWAVSLACILQCRTCMPCSPPGKPPWCMPSATLIPAAAISRARIFCRAGAPALLSSGWLNRAMGAGRRQRRHAERPYHGHLAYVAHPGARPPSRLVARPVHAAAGADSRRVATAFSPPTRCSAPPSRPASRTTLCSARRWRRHRFPAGLSNLQGSAWAAGTFLAAPNGPSIAALRPPATTPMTTRSAGSRRASPISTAPCRFSRPNWARRGRTRWS